VIVIESYPLAEASAVCAMHLALNPGHVVEVIRCADCGGTPIGLWCQTCPGPLCAIEEAHT